jgi:hypothetical protein
MRRFAIVRNVRPLRLGRAQPRVVLWPILIAVLLGWSALESRVTLAASVPLIDLDPATQLSNSPGPGMYFGFTDVNIDGLIGWTFNVLEPITVTGLAWYDNGADGLSHEHDVTLTRTGIPTSLLTAAISAGTTASLLGSWREVATAPLTLMPGSYTILGTDFTTTPDILKFAGGGQPLPTDARVDPLQTPVFEPNGGGGGSLLSSGVWLGPMLFVQPVPEPGTIVLAGMALFFLALVRRRRS